VVVTMKYLLALLLLSSIAAAQVEEPEHV